ncbi:MAG: hypothetical protein ABH836_07015 [Candidatus Omnitrophota bacterium]
MNFIMVSLIILITAFLGFTLQVWPRFFNRYFGIDTWRHLDIADYIRKNGFPERMPSKYLIDGPFDYPPLFLWLLSKFSGDFLKRYEWLFSPALNVLNSLLVLGITFFLTGNFWGGLMAMALFMLTPIIALEASQLSTRPIGVLLFNLVYFAVLYFSAAHSLSMFLISVVLLAVLLLTHKMPVQVLFFLFIFFSFLDKTFWYMAILLAGMILATVVSKGYYIKIFKGHMAILNFWRVNIKNRYAHQIRGLKEDKASPDPIIKIQQLIRKIPVASVFGSNPWIVFILIALFFIKPQEWNYFGMNQCVFLKILYTPLFLCAVSFVVKLIKPLGFLGEAERYLEYSALPAGIAAIYLLFAGTGNFYLLIFILLTALVCIGSIIFLQRKIVLQDKERTVTKELFNMFDYLNQLKGKEEIRLATLPLYLVAFTMYFVDGIKVLSTESAVAHITGLSDYFPVLKKPLSEIFAGFGINYCLVNEHYVGVSEINLPCMEIVKREGHYTLIKV